MDVYYYFFIIKNDINNNLDINTKIEKNNNIKKIIIINHRLNTTK